MFLKAHHLGSTLPAGQAIKLQIPFSARGTGLRRGPVYSSFLCVFLFLFLTTQDMPDGDTNAAGQEALCVERTNDSALPLNPCQTCSWFNANLFVESCAARPTSKRSPDVSPAELSA